MPASECHGFAGGYPGSSFTANPSYRTTRSTASMRDTRLLASAFTLCCALGCDSGESSIPPSEEPTSNTVGSTVTTAAQSATSTTGSRTPGGGLVYETGKGCTPGVLTVNRTLQGRWDKVKVAMDGL